MSEAEQVAAWRRLLPGKGNQAHQQPSEGRPRKFGGRGHHRKAIRKKTETAATDKTQAVSIAPTTTPTPPTPVNPSLTTPNANVPATRGLWGDVMESKPDDVFRVVFQNCSGLTLAQTDLIRRIVDDLAIDVLGMAEVNVDWSKTSANERPANRFRGFWENLHHRTAHLQRDRHYADSRHQFGGVMMLSINEACNRVASSGSDSMGRWTWVRYEGKGNQGLRIITAYRPCRNATGLTSTYSQQAQHLLSKNDARDPKAAFDEDLLVCLDEWLKGPEHLILMMDANADVRQPKFRQLRSLSEINISRHGGNPPPTTSWGQRPIDGIWVSEALIDSRSGYLDFGEGLHSDHRALWIDLPIASTFGSTTLKTQRPSARKLKLEDPRVVDKFLADYSKIVREKSLLERAKRLLEATDGRLIPAQIQEFEALDLARTEGMLEAERHCRKLKTGAIPWTPEITAAQRRITYHRLSLKKLQGHKISAQTVCRAARRAGIQPTLTTESQAQTLLHHSIVAYHQLKKRSGKQARATFLQRLALAKADKGDTDAETELSNLIRVEEQRERFRIIKQAHAASQRGGLTRVTSTSPDGSTVESTSKEEIEAACLAENDSRFSQAKDTPFLTEPLLADFGLLGKSEVVQAVLNGTYEPPENADFYAKGLLEFLLRPQHVEDFSMEVTIDDYIQGWRRAKERTSAGPSRLHFGHFKSLIESPELAELEVTLLNILVRSGYSPSRWRKGLNVMLLKKLGCYDPKTFRTILLYEADLNFLLKLLGRRMMANAERHGLLAREQYGSRKNHTAIRQVLNKVLTYDMIRLRQIPGALCSNDAKSCYDRIVHSVAKMSMMRCGAPETTIDLMFDTIQRLQHFIRTAYGDSTISFGGDPKPGDAPKHGVGQGNGGGPAIWIATNNPFFALLEAAGTGVALQSAIAGEPIRITAYSLVDDTDIPQVAETTTTATEVLAALQKAVDIWEGALRATGGAIVPAKSFWYLVDFERNAEGVAKYKKKAVLPGDLTVLDTNGERVTLERLECSEGRRTLGVRAAPDGNQQAEFEYLRDVFAKWADRARTSGFDRTTLWMNLTMTILKKLEYPLPATCFTRQQCQDIMKPLRHCLPKIGFNHNLPTALVFGPPKALGLGLPELYTTQGIQHIAHMITLGHKKDDATATLLRGVIEQTKIEVGLGGSLFSHDSRPLQALLTPSWIKSTWDFLSEHELLVEETTPSLQLQRQNDVFLVEAFLVAGYNGPHLRRLNWCRLFLHAITLSDICNADGSQLTILAWEGERDPSVKSQYRWPSLPRPSAKTWDAWREALATTFCTRQTRRIDRQLGHWFTHHRRSWLFSPSENRLYQHTLDGWVYYSNAPAKARTRHSQKRYHAQEQHARDQPTDLQVATILSRAPYITLTGHGPVEPTPPPPPKGSLLAQMESCKDRWALQEVKSTDDGRTIAAAIISGRCIAVSDGSEKDGIGTAAWVLEGDSSKHRIKGLSIVPGSDADQSSYRSEYAGLYSLIYAVSKICEYHDIQAGTVELCCDGLGPLTRTSHPEWFTHSTERCFDFKEATATLMKKCPIRWKFRHIFGHQDETTPHAELDRYAQLNIEMDAAAKEFRERLSRQQRLRPWTIEGEPWRLWIGQRKISSYLQREILEAIHLTNSFDYWAKKGRFGEGNPTMVDWEHQDRAVRSSTNSRQRFYIKHASGFSGVGRKMQQIGAWETAQCCRCNAPIETSEHVLRCPHPEATRVWERALQSFEAHLKRSKTDPTIVTAIIQNMQRWREGEAPMENHQTSTVRQALQEQSVLGWRSFIEGLPSKKWAEAQATHAQRRKQRQQRFSPGQWASRLIRWVWEIPWQMWEHRNNILHESGVIDPSMQETDRRIREELATGDIGLDPATRAVFNQQRATILQKKPEIRRLWLQRIITARKRDTEVGMRRGLRNWLHSAQPAARFSMG